MGRVWYGWVGTWVGNTGTPSTLLEEGPEPAKRAPEACRAGVGGFWGRTYRGRRRDGSWVPTLRARSVPCWALPGTQDPQNAASQPIRARFRLFFSKVSQNHRVSPVLSEKACHSPYIQNGSQKSPLGILRIPFSAAFSHKELMGPF